MQHERRVLPQQARRINAQREVAADALAPVIRDGGLGFAIDPPALHVFLKLQCWTSLPFENLNRFSHRRSEAQS
jgi:hypothetical protein